MLVGVSTLDWLLQDRRPGHEGRVLGQAPNLPSLLTTGATVTALVARAAGAPRIERAASWAGVVASVWWAAGELTSGVNPFRRIQGGLALAATAATAVRLARS